MLIQLERLQRIINYRFSQPELAELSLSHGSLVSERDNLPPGGNQRLELLGDAVIGLALAETLYRQFPESREGLIASMRSELSRGEVLAACARRLQLESLLMVGSGEARLNPDRTDAMMEDALEAIVGAVFLDGGYLAAAGVVRKILAKELADCIQGGIPQTNPKGALQELAQADGECCLPVYEVIEEAGPDHNKSFKVRVTLKGRSATGGGSSRKAAESAAAKALLEELLKVDTGLG
jgi:ribonuclease-3